MQNQTTTSGRLRSELTEQRCPSCEATIPVHQGYVTWCECGWNLKPYEPGPPNSFYEKMRLRLSEKLGEGIFNTLMRAEALTPSFTFSRAAAYALAISVHLITLLFALLGVFLLTWGWPHVMAICFGAVSLLAAWYTRPRLGRFPRKKVASRERYPTLYGIVDEVAAVLGAKKIDGVMFSDQYGASIQQLGPRGRTLMTLGVPLLAMLSDEERVALIGHEIGHTINGDCTRSTFIGGALTSLAIWYVVILPDRIIMKGYGYVGLAMVPVNLALFALASVIWSWFYALLYLVFHDAQRAEFLTTWLRKLRAPMRTWRLWRSRSSITSMSTASSVPPPTAGVPCSKSWSTS